MFCSLGVRTLHRQRRRTKSAHHYSRAPVLCSAARCCILPSAHQSKVFGDWREAFFEWRDVAGLADSEATKRRKFEQAVFLYSNAKQCVMHHAKLTGGRQCNANNRLDEYPHLRVSFIESCELPDGTDGLFSTLIKGTKADEAHERAQKRTAYFDAKEKRIVCQ